MFPGGKKSLQRRTKLESLRNRKEAEAAAEWLEKRKKWIRC